MKTTTALRTRTSTRILAGSIAALVTAGFLAAPEPAQAVGLWTGNVDGTWSGLNWDAAPSALDPLVFDDVNLTGALVTATTNDGFLAAVAGITFNGVSYSIGGSAFTLNGAINTTGAATISANVTLGAGGGSLVTNAASSLNFTGTFDAGSQALSLSGAGDVTYSGAISNGTTLAKSGGGTLTLAGSNAFSTLSTSAGIITGGTITLSAGATALTSSSSSAVNSNVTITTAAGTITSSAGTLTLGGTVDAGSLALTFAGAGNTTLSSAIANGTTLTKNDAGTLTLGGASNVFTSATINGGTVTGSTLTLSSGATALTSSATSAVNSNVTITTAAGTITSSSGTLTLGGTVDAGSLALTFAGAGNTTLSSAIANGTTLTKNDAGTLTLAGTNAFTAATITGGTITGGAITLSSGATALTSSATSAVNSNVTITTAAGTITSSAGILTLGGTLNAGGLALTFAGAGDTTVTNAIASGTTLTKGGAGTLTLNGANTYTGVTTISAGELKIGGAGNLNGGNYAANIANDGTLRYSSSSNQTLSGIVSGSGSLIKDTSGSTLSIGSNAAANTYSGGTTINAGTLTPVNALAVNPFGTGSITVNAGATLALNRNNMINSLFLNSGTVLATNGFGDSWTAPIVLTGTSIIDLQGTGSLSITGNISGAGGLTKNGNGSGPVTLNGAGTYLGTTTINAGTLRLGTGTAGQNGTITGSIVNNATLTFNNGSAQTHSGDISGTGVVTKSGAGTLTMAVANSYAGATTISVGTFILGAAGDATNTPLGTTAGSTTVTATGAALDVGGFTLGTAEALTLNGSGVAGAGALTNSGGAAAYSGAITLASAVTIGSSSGTLTLTGGISGAQALTFAGAGDTTLTNAFASGTTLTKSGAGTLTLTGTNGFTAATISGGTITGGTLTLSSGATALTGSATSAVNSNVTITTAAGTITSSTAANTLTLGGTVDAGSFDLTFAGAGNTTVTNAIANSTTLTKSGAGTLTLNAASSGTGAVTIGAGTLKVGADGALGTSAAAVTVSATGAALDLNGVNYATASALTLNGTGVSSGGALTNSGGAATYAGLLTLGSASSIVASSGDIVLSHAGTITGATFGLTLSGTATGSSLASIIGTTSGAVTKSGTGTWTLSGANTFTGQLTVQNGTLATATINDASTNGVLGNSALAVILGNAGAQTGTLQYTGGGTVSSTKRFTMGTGGTGAFQVDTAGTILTLSGVIDGSGALTKTGAGTLVLTGTNTHSGNTLISAGTLELGNNLALQNSAFNTSGAGTLAFSAGINTPTFGGLAGATNLTLPANVTALTLNPGGGATVTYSGILGSVTAGMTLTKTGVGTQVLSGANTYTGATAINAGALNIQHATALGTIAGNTTVASGAALQLQGGITVGAEALSLNGTGIVSTGALRNISGANVWQGTVTLVGSPAVRINSDSGSLTFNTAATSISAAGNAPLNLGGGGNGTVGGVIATGSGTVTKDGAGTWTLSGANTFTGQTIVNLGVLRLDNATSLNGGIGAAGGLTNINLNGTTDGSNIFSAIIGLGNGDFSRGLGSGVTQVQFGGNGGWAAFGADRIVNLGGAAASVAWATATTGFNGKALVLGTSTATHTVDLQNAIDMGSAARTVVVDNGAAAIDAKMSGPITGIASGNLTKSGTGTLVLSGTNNYVGTTTVSGGLLRVNGTHSGTGAVAVNAFAALGGTGTLAGAVTVATNGAIDLRNLTTGNLTLTSTLTFSGTAAAPNNLHFDLGGGAATTDKIVTTGAVTAGGASGVLVNFNQLAGGAVTPGTYTLIQPTAASTYANYALATTRSGGNVYSGLAASGNNLVVTIATATAGPVAAFWAGGATPWSTLANWKTDATSNVALGSIPGVGTNVTFATTTPVATTLTTNTVDVDFEINSLGFNATGGGVTIGGTKMLTIDATTANGNAANNGITSSNTSGTNTISTKIGLGGNQTWTTNGGTLAVSGVVSDFNGGYSLTKAGAGTLTLSAVNTITGPLTISAGELQIGGAGSLLSGGYAGNITNNGTLRYNSTVNDYTFSGIFSGTGALIKDGTAKIFLTGANTYSGGTTINAGIIEMGIQQQAALGSGPVTVNASGQLNLNRGGMTNSLFLNSGKLAGGNGFGDSWNGPVTLTGTSTIDLGGTGAITINGDISGAGGFTKTNGAGALTLTGTNTYTGVMLISAGVLAITKPAALYNAVETSWTPANITLNSGTTLLLSVGGATGFSGTQIGTLLTNLTTVNNNGLKAGALVALNTAGGNTTVSSNITDSTGTGGGSIGFDKYGNNTLTLSGANTYTGKTVIHAGNGGISAASFNSVNGGAPLLASSSLGRPLTIPNGTIDLGDGSTSGGAFLTYTGTGETTDRVIRLAGQGTNNHTLTQSGTGLLKFTSAFTINGNTSQGLTLAGSTAGTGEIGAALPMVAGTLTKNGTGTWTLSGANTYTGVTTVSGGALVLNNATALPGGIGVAGGTSALTFTGGVLGLGNGNFTRSLAAAGTVTGATFTGAGGWAAYTADRVVNLGGALTPITWATASTGFNGQTLILGNVTSTHMVDLQNPLVLGTAARTVQVDDGTGAIDGKLSGGLTGAAGGNLTKTGAGTLQLTNANTYVGTTTVSAGTLNVATGGSVTGTTSLNIRTGGAVTIDGTVTIANTGNFGVGAGVTSTTGSMTVNTGGVLNIGNGGATAAGYTAIGGQDTTGTGMGSGTLIIAGGTVNVAIAGTGGPSGLDATALWLNPYSNNAAATSTIHLNGGTLSTARPISWGTTAGPTSIFNFNGGTLQAAATSGNFLDILGSATSRINVRNGVAAIDTQAFNITINSSNPLLHSNIGGDNATDGGLTKTGTGTLTLDGANTYTGTTTVNVGTLALGNVNALGTIPGTNGTSGITMATGTTLRTPLTTGTTVYAPITTSGNVTINAPTTNTGLQTWNEFFLNGAIGGTGNVTFSNIVNANTILTVTLGAASNYAGTTTIDNTAGTAGQMFVKLGATNALPTTTVLNILGQAGTGSGRGIELNMFGFSQTLAGLTNTAFTLRTQRVVNSDVSAAATLTIDGSTNTTFSGSLGTNSPNFSVNPLTIPGSTNGNNFGLTKNGTGTFTITGSNPYLGVTKILGGILSLGNSNAMQNSPLDTLNSIAGDATNGLRTTVTTLTMGGLTGNKDLASVFETVTGGYGTVTALTLNPGTGATPSYSGIIADGAAGMTLTKSGLGTQTLSVANTYTGATSVTAGTLQLDGSTHASSTVGIATAGTLTGTGTVNGNATLTGSGIINKSSGTIAGTLGVTGGNWNGAGAVTGLATSSSGVFNIGTGANLTANGNLDVTGGSLSGTDATSMLTGSLNYTSTTSSSFGGVIAGSGKTVTVNAATTLTLSGANTYTGTTAVSSGTLSFNSTAAGAGAQALGGNTGASAVTLGVAATSSGILSYTGGTAALDKNIGVLGNGSDAVQNNGAGVLTLSGGITGANTALTISGAGDTTITTTAVNLGAASGALTKNGAGLLNINSGAQTYKTLTTTAGAGTTNVNVALTATGGTDVVANAKLRFGSVSQTLSSLTIGAGSTVIFTSGAASGSFSGGGGSKSPSLGGGSAVVPEPGTLGLLLVGALGVLNRRRRA